MINLKQETRTETFLFSVRAELTCGFNTCPPASTVFTVPAVLCDRSL